VRNWIAALPVAVIAAGCATPGGVGAPARVDVIAHRGASAYSPENTLTAFRLAYEMGADWFELDCTLTADEQVIVIHDDTVDRTTNGEGEVAEMTLAELKRLDAGSWKDPKFAGEGLPALAESLDLAKGYIGVYIEIKDSGNDSELKHAILEECGKAEPGPDFNAAALRVIEREGTRNLTLTREVIRQVRQRGMREDVVIQSFSPVVCIVALAEAPDIRTEYLGADDPDQPARWQSYLEWGRLMDPAGYNISKGSVTAERVAMFHDGGKTVAVWTVNEADAIERQAQMGVDAVITDRPDLAADILLRMGLR
jgi:glycerophosphoryl diester phosphodiesterase